uniref:SprT-like domain-containing protein n=1 Tax=Ditylenchus dipsaci TaxID=166011 RepID=A0A915CL27_9BILA
MLLLLLILCIAYHKYQLQNKREEELKQQKDEINKQQLKVTCVVDEGKEGNHCSVVCPNCEMTAESSSFNAQKKQPKKDAVPLPVSTPAPPAVPAVPVKNIEKKVPAAVPAKSSKKRADVLLPGKSFEKGTAVAPNDAAGVPHKPKKQSQKKKAKKRTAAKAIRLFFVRQFTELSLSGGSDREVEPECILSGFETAVDAMIPEETADNQVDADGIANPEITQNQTMQTETQQTILSEEYAGKDEKLRKRRMTAFISERPRLRKLIKEAISRIGCGSAPLNLLCWWCAPSNEKEAEEIFRSIFAILNRQLFKRKLPVKPRPTFWWIPQLYLEQEDGRKCSLYGLSDILEFATPIFSFNSTLCDSMSLYCGTVVHELVHCYLFQVNYQFPSAHGKRFGNEVQRVAAFFRRHQIPLNVRNV